MERMNDDEELKEIKNVNITSNFQNQKPIKENPIKHNFLKIKFLLNEFINSNIKLDKKEIEDNFANNLFIPFHFKNKRPNKLIDISNNISLEEDSKSFKNKIKENTKDYSSKNINYTLNNIQKETQDSISSNINIQNNNILDKNLDKVSSQINVGDKILGKKRKLDGMEEKTEKNETTIIYEKIKKIYNDFIRNNKIHEKTKNNIIIYDHKKGYFESQETIIIRNNPVCVIYFKDENIKNIFLIKEQNSYEDEKNIKYILEKIKSDLESLCNNNSY